MTTRGAAKPIELIELELCELFHCLPSQLDEEDPARLFALFTAKVARDNQQARQARRH